jgi:hypothetical protein
LGKVMASLETQIHFGIEGDWRGLMDI